MKHVAIEIQGVLRDPVNLQPAPDGRSLYSALAESYRITLLADEDHGIEHWLMVEGFDRHTSVRYADNGMTRYLQIQALRALGPLDLVVTAEPEIAHPLFNLGQAHLVYIHPRQYTTLPPRQDWDQLVERIDADRTRAAKALLAAEEDQE